MFINIKIQVYFLVFLLIACFGCSPREVHVHEDDVQKTTNVDLLTVKNVISGDTIELEDGRIVKYINIQAPKQGDPLYLESRDANSLLIAKGGNKVFVEFGSPERDSQGNYLAYVYTPTRTIYYCFINKELVEWGWAKVKIVPPNTRYVESFLFSESNAKEKKLNIWK